MKDRLSIVREKFTEDVIKDMTPKMRFIIIIWSVFCIDRFMAFMSFLSQGKSVKFSFNDAAKMSRKEVKEFDEGLNDEKDKENY
ncbi:MAG TPA: hypothetical protein VMZ91_04495 [Candidatus Paceibacterota bacterium]|nr:hypothetical protein [Candidatus Paceibacterota bacterium]